MKKTIVVLLACALLGGMLSACGGAYTPGGQNVSRDTEQMIATAALPAGTAEGRTLRGALGVPERVEETLPTRMEKFSIQIAADVSVPDTDHLSVYRVSAAEFSEDFVAKAFDYLCKGETMYDYSNLFKTKDWIQGQINSMQRDLDMNDSPDDPSGGDAWRADYEAEIAELKLELANARDDLGDPLTEAKLSMEETAGNGKQEKFEAVNTPNMPCTVEFYVRNNVNDPTDEVRYIERTNTTVAPRSEAGLYYNDHRRVGSEWYQLRDVTNEASIAELKTTPQEALEQVAAILKTLGMEQMNPLRVVLAGDAAGADAKNYIYGVEVCRVVDGVEVRSPYSRTYVGGLDGGYEWAYETFEVLLDDEGIIGLNWTSPLTVGSVEVERANLLPFASILTVAKNMLGVVNEPLETDLKEYQSVSIKIDHITLSLQRIPNADSIQDGLLVPVWNFYGQEHFILSDGQEENRGNDLAVSLRQEPYLSINAIDGSVINKTLGY
ncbi:MAG: DUF6034 family protein [Christensenella sp.]|nr:DUF6034 family protein [Christensenella sp.]